MRKIPKTISEDEFIEILNYEKNKRNRVIYALGFYECMRVSEIANLKPENINVKGKIIEIKQGKGNKDRNIPISPRIPSGFVKYFPLGIGIRMIQTAFKRAVLGSLGPNYSWVHFHTLRHSGATYYLNVKKWDIRHVQVFLGHSRLETTEIYTHVRPEDLVKLMLEG